MNFKKRFLPVTQYFPALSFFCLCACNTAFGQQPGGPGVPGAKIWLMPAKQAGQYRWLTVNGNTGVSVAIPGLNDTANINYHIAFKFPLSNPVIKINNLKPVSIVTAFYPNIETGSIPVPDSFFTLKFNHNFLVKSSYDQLMIDGPLMLGNQFPIMPNPKSSAMKIWAGYFSGFPAFDLSNPAGLTKETTLSMIFNGYCPEMLIYETALSPMDLWKLQTYFAIKYAITLDTSYIATDGKTILWDMEKRKLEGFHNRVCAIGKDVSGTIDQPIANSSYEDGTYNAYQNKSNSSKRSVSIGFDLQNYPDKAFLFWGDDGGSISTSDLQKRSIEAADTSGKIEIVQRRWIMQNTQHLAQTTRVELGGILHENLQNDYCYLLIKLDGRLDSSDIYPFDQVMSNTKWFRSGIAWKYGIDTFTFGRVEKLRFDTNEVRCDDKKRCDGFGKDYGYNDENIIGKKRFPLLSHCKYVIGFKYRTHRSDELECMDLPDIPSNAVEVYFSGGSDHICIKLTISLLRNYNKLEKSIKSTLP